VITANTHFALAVQALATLALSEGPTSSTVLAQRLQTHPAFLRGVLGPLREAQLITTRRGKAGGSVLARPAEEITLLDVYRVTDGAAEVAPHRCHGGPCPVASGMPEVLARLGQRLDAALARELSAITVADIVGWLGPLSP